MKNKIIQVIIFLNVTFFVSQSLFADTHYVSKTGWHVSPFLSSANAATNIQAAVDVASSNDIVLVNNGTYYLNNYISIRKKIIVKSVNGAKQTIVDGNNAHRGFYLNDTNPTLDGFTITNGHVDGNYPYYYGSGIYCDNGGTIQNCIIRGNGNANLGYHQQYGGGIYCNSGGFIENCIIENNFIFGNSGYGKGGGVYLNGGGIIQNCTIKYNSTSFGGGVYCKDGGIIQDCIIIGNSADEGGGGVNCYKSGLVQNCIIRENSSSSGSGGGISCNSGGTFQDCIISDNSAQNGGGVSCNIDGMIQNCNINGNYAGPRNYNSGSGGGIYCKSGGTIQNCRIFENISSSGGGVYCRYGGLVENSIISNNFAKDYAGGGVTCNGGTVQNCTIIGNTASNFAGGINCYDGVVQNCTIIGNSASNGIGGVYCAQGGTVLNSVLWDNSVSNYFSPDSTNHYNCIENWTNFGNGIITNKPQFISDSNFRLQNTSPCKNSGTNDQYVFETFDLDGNSRIMGVTVDMGAYEYIEAFQYPPFLIPVINDSEINCGKIKWQPIPLAEDYIVQEQFRGTQGIWAIKYTITNLNLIVQRLSNAYYRVAAHNSFGNSDWSIPFFYSNYPINFTSLNASQLSDGSGYVSIQTKIKDQNLDLSNLKFEYSLNNGASWANGDPFLVSITQSGQSPSINNSSEYQANNVLPDDSTITILWDTISTQNGGGSLANQRIEQTKIRVTPRNAYSSGYSFNSSAYLIDNSAVSNVSVAINHNDLTTTSPNVSLQLHAEGSGNLYMRISNGTDFGNSPWQAYSSLKSWSLSPSSGTKTVYVQFKNEKGYVSSAQDSIILNNLDYSNFEGTNDVTFLMGRSGSVADESPAHYVNITTTSMYKTEISNFEFAQFLSEGGYSDNSYWSSAGWSWKTANNIVCPLNWEITDTPNYANDPYSNSDSEPVVGISYYEAEAYANWSDYELPTESQWEYFAKDGDERHYPWADDFWYTSTQPNFNLCNWKIGFEGFSENGYTSDGSEFTRYVTSYSEGKGHCGHYNLSGNVAEWVKDWYGTYGAATVTDPEGPANGTERVVRGGSFVHERDDLTTTRRMHYSPEFRTNWLGMRVAKNDIVPEGGIGFLILNFIFLFCHRGTENTEIIY